MVKSLQIIKYKKLKDLQIDFIPGINVVSGTNGTCNDTFWRFCADVIFTYRRNTWSFK